MQVNGKLRDRVPAPAGALGDEHAELARESAKVAAHFDGKPVVKTIVVPGKLVNFVRRLGVPAVSAHRYVAVVGPGEATGQELATAEEVGRLLAEAGAVLVCGGLGGAMEAACRGAKRAGGTTVGILPGHRPCRREPHVDVALATGLGEARNALVVRAADALIAVGGGFGTLSEIALALKTGKPVIGIGSWELSRGGVADAARRSTPAMRARPSGWRSSDAAAVGLA